MGVGEHPEEILEVEGLKVRVEGDGDVVVPGEEVEEEDAVEGEEGDEEEGGDGGEGGEVRTNVHGWRPDRGR